MLGEEQAPKAKKAKKEEKKARKRAKKDAKREAKRARRESKKGGASSSSSSDDEGGEAAARGGPVPLPAAARWQGPAPAPVPSIAELEAQLAAARSARLARAAAGPAPTAFGSSQIMPLRQSQAELQMRGLRAARFEQTAAEKALAAAASRPEPKLPAGQVLQGSSQALEKSYLRLTSMPRADQVRPLPVLREAFALVGERWKKERDYEYACEQLKSIRQDLTVQHLTVECSRFAVQVYEAHARLALQAGDYGEFGQCQSQLVTLHADPRGLSSHRDEFVAYRILHCLATRAAALSQDLHSMLGGMSLAAPGAAGGDGGGGAGGAGGGAGGADGGAVAQAVRVGVALQTGDFRSFFRELRRMHNLGAEILKPLIPAQRRTALEKICRAYQPSLPVARVAALLGFAGGAAEAAPWLRGLGAVIVRGGETGNEPQLECRASAQALRDLRSGVEAGPPLPPSAARR